MNSLFEVKNQSNLAKIGHAIDSSLKNRRQYPNLEGSSDILMSHFNKIGKKILNFQRVDIFNF